MYVLSLVLVIRPAVCHTHTHITQQQQHNVSHHAKEARRHRQAEQSLTHNFRLRCLRRTLLPRNSVSQLQCTVRPWS